MSLCNFETLEPSPAPEDILATLARALDGRRVAAAHRIPAGDDSRGPDEGLALLEAYIGIADKDTRQAILDLIGAIARSDPYRRSRTRTVRDPGPAKPVAEAATGEPTGPRRAGRSA